MHDYLQSSKYFVHMKTVAFECFPINCLFSYACKVFTSRPAGCISTSRIWDGKTIKRNTQGNSALYILEDEVIPGIIFCPDKEKKTFTRIAKKNFNIEFSGRFNVLVKRPTS